MMITKWRYFDDDGIPTFYNSGIETTADNVVDALNAIENQFADLQVHIDALRAQLAARDALIERLVDCGDALADSYDSEMYPETAIESRNWRALVAEWKASKDGGSK